MDLAEAAAEVAAVVEGDAVAAAVRAADVERHARLAAEATAAASQQAPNPCSCVLQAPRFPVFSVLFWYLLISAISLWLVC